MPDLPPPDKSRRPSDITLSPGAEFVKGERLRQITGEGYTFTNDEVYVNGELRDAAQAYLMFCDPELRSEAEGIWPWAADLFKPSDEDPMLNLAKAGALIAAEIDRILWALAGENVKAHRGG